MEVGKEKYRNANKENVDLTIHQIGDSNWPLNLPQVQIEIPDLHFSME